MALKALLALEDGKIFTGNSCGVTGVAEGEAVFNTSMCGYQEILTDPSYSGQLVCMTYPQIGNYGIAKTDFESKKPRLRGFIMRECCPYPSNFAASQALPDYLKEQGIIAIEGIDTRSLAKHIRHAGAMRAVLAAGDDFAPSELVAQAQKSPGLVGQDLVSGVTCQAPYPWTEKCDWFNPAIPAAAGKKIIVYDFGVKQNILRMLCSCGFQVEVVPASTKAGDVLAKKPAGVFLSNGPGDPEPLTGIIAEIKNLIGQKPLFGICLGHQLLGLACGAKTFKLKFGHRGANHPIKHLATGQVAVTSQNHGFCLEPESLKNTGLEVTHMNLNDNTIAGIKSSAKNLMGVQYHPEAAAGPHDAQDLFADFAKMVCGGKD